MEESNRLLNENKVQLVTGVEHGAIILAASGSCNILNARTCCTVDIVDKGELKSI